MEVPLLKIATDPNAKEATVPTIKLAPADKVTSNSLDQEKVKENDRSFKRIFRKLYTAYKNLTPVIDEVINSTAADTLSELQNLERNNFPICSVTQGQYIKAINASILIQEVNNEIVQNDKYRKDVVNKKILQFPVTDLIKTVQKLCCANTENEFLNNVMQRIYIKKPLVSQFVKLYKLLHGVLQQLYYIAKEKHDCIKATNIIFVKNNQSTGENPETSSITLNQFDVSVDNGSKNLRRLAKLEAEYKGLSDTVNILKSIMQDTPPGSTEDIIRLKKTQKNAKKVKSTNFLVQPKNNQKVTDISGARRCILECLVELGEVRKNLKGVQNAKELNMANKIQLSKYSKPECCSRQDVPHLHAKLNGIAVVLKLNKETVDKILSSVEQYSDQNEDGKTINSNKVYDYLYTKLFPITEPIIQSTNKATSNDECTSKTRKKYLINWYARAKPTQEKIRICTGTNETTAFKHKNEKLIKEYKLNEVFKDSPLQILPKIRVTIGLKNSIRNKGIKVRKVPKCQNFLPKSLSQHSGEKVKFTVSKRLNVLKRKSSYLAKLYTKKVLKGALQTAGTKKLMKMCFNIKKSASAPEHNVSVNSIRTLHNSIIGSPADDVIKLRATRLNANLLTEKYNALHEENNTVSIPVPTGKQVENDLFNCIHNSLTSATTVHRIPLSFKIIKSPSNEKNIAKEIETKHLTVSKNKCSTTNHYSGKKMNFFAVDSYWPFPDIYRKIDFQNLTQFDLLRNDLMPLPLITEKGITSDEIKRNKNFKIRSKNKSYHSKLDYYVDLLEKRFSKNLRKVYEVRYFALKGSSPEDKSQKQEADLSGEGTSGMSNERPTATTDKRANKVYIAKSKYYNYPDRDDTYPRKSVDRRETFPGTSIAFLPMAPATGHIENNPLLIQPWAPFITSDVSLPRIPGAQIKDKDPEYSISTHDSSASKNEATRPGKPISGVSSADSRYVGSSNSKGIPALPPTAATISGVPSADSRYVGSSNSNRSPALRPTLATGGVPSTDSRYVGSSDLTGRRPVTVATNTEGMIVFEFPQRGPKNVSNRNCDCSTCSGADHTYDKFKMAEKKNQFSQSTYSCSGDKVKRDYSAQASVPVQQAKTRNPCSCDREKHDSSAQAYVPVQQAQAAQSSYSCVCGQEKCDSSAQAYVPVQQVKASQASYSCLCGKEKRDSSAQAYAPVQHSKAAQASYSCACDKEKHDCSAQAYIPVEQAQASCSISCPCDKEKCDASAQAHVPVQHKHSQICKQYSVARNPLKPPAKSLHLPTPSQSRECPCHKVSNTKPSQGHSQRGVAFNPFLNIVPHQHVHQHTQCHQPQNQHVVQRYHLQQQRQQQQEVLQNNVCNKIPRNQQAQNANLRSIQESHCTSFNARQNKMHIMQVSCKTDEQAVFNNNYSKYKDGVRPVQYCLFNNDENIILDKKSKINNTHQRVPYQVTKEENNKPTLFEQPSISSVKLSPSLNKRNTVNTGTQSDLKLPYRLVLDKQKTKTDKNYVEHKTSNQHHGILPKADNCSALQSNSAKNCLSRNKQGFNLQHSPQFSMTSQNKISQDNNKNFSLTLMKYISLGEVETPSKYAINKYEEKQSNIQQISQKYLVDLQQEKNLLAQRIRNLHNQVDMSRESISIGINTDHVRTHKLRDSSTQTTLHTKMKLSSSEHTTINVNHNKKSQCPSCQKIIKHCTSEKNWEIQIEPSPNSVRINEVPVVQSQAKCSSKNDNKEDICRCPSCERFLLTFLKDHLPDLQGLLNITSANQMEDIKKKTTIANNINAAKYSIIVSQFQNASTNTQTDEQLINEDAVGIEESKCYDKNPSSNNSYLQQSVKNNCLTQDVDDGFKDGQSISNQSSIQRYSIEELLENNKLQNNEFEESIDKQAVSGSIETIIQDACEAVSSLSSRNSINSNADMCPHDLVSDEPHRNISKSQLLTYLNKLTMEELLGDWIPQDYDNSEFDFNAFEKVVRGAVCSAVKQSGISLKKGSPIYKFNSVYDTNTDITENSLVQDLKGPTKPPNTPSTFEFKHLNEPQSPSLFCTALTAQDTTSAVNSNDTFIVPSDFKQNNIRIEHKADQSHNQNEKQHTYCVHEHAKENKKNKHNQKHMDSSETQCCESDVIRETGNEVCESKSTVCWALTKIKTNRNGSQDIEIIETSSDPPGHFLIPSTNSVILMGKQSGKDFLQKDAPVFPF